METLKKHLSFTLMLFTVAALIGATVAVACAPYSTLGAIAAGALVPIAFMVWSSTEALKLFRQGEHPFQEDLEIQTEPEVATYRIVGMVKPEDIPLRCICRGCGKREPYCLPEGWGAPPDPTHAEDRDEVPCFPLCPKCLPCHPEES